MVRALLQDAEEVNLQTLQSIVNESTQVSYLKDSVLLLLDVLGQCETPEPRHETLEVVQRQFIVYLDHRYDAQSYTEMLMDHQHVIK